MAKIQHLSKGGNAGDSIAVGDGSYAEGGNGGDAGGGVGGDGGSAHAIGKDSVAVGGKGGRGGRGKGGPGMCVVVMQEGVRGYGGDGGESSQHDGRGGRGGAAPMMSAFGAEFARRAGMRLQYGMLNIFPGRGGDSPDTPQYKARRLIVEQFKAKYFIQHGIPTEGAAAPNSSDMLPVEWRQALMTKCSDVWYDREIVPLVWINEQLHQAGHKWSATIEAQEYVFVDVSCAI